MFPCSHPDYVFVTKIPKMLILYFIFLKNNDNPSLNDTVVIESALYVSFVLYECFVLFLADSASCNREQFVAHICTHYSNNFFKQSYYYYIWEYKEKNLDWMGLMLPVVLLCML